MVSTDEQPRTRLADLAALSGVSTATVSRVLNRRPGVADATRQAVYNAMDMLGYERPRHSASQSAGLVGLIVPELTNPVFPAFAQTIETALAHHGYTPLLCTQTASGISEDEYVESLMAANVAGIIFVNGMHADTNARLTRYERLKELAVPFVLVNGYREELGSRRSRSTRSPGWTPPCATSRRWGTPGSPSPSGRTGSCPRCSSGRDSSQR
ncbi:LacI family DNA-binding transcriptional regulator [Salana multivorans]